MSKKILLGLIALLFVFSVKSQETLIVRGFLEPPTIRVSGNFQRSMFCYFNGGFITQRFNDFSIFRVDSVISGSFPNFNNEINQTPFNISLTLINETVVLEYRQYYTLQINQFPYTNYFYIKTINQVFNHEKYLEKVAEFHKNHQRNIDILTNGTLQERRDFLELRQRTAHITRYKDLRYIPYVLPYMTSTDSVVVIWELHGHDYETGEIHRWQEKHWELYSDFLRSYLNNLLPFRLPDIATDSIGWHRWYDSITSLQNCFQYVTYASSLHKAIVEASRERTLSLTYFIPDIPNRVIHFMTGSMAYTLNIDTDKLTEHSVPRNRFPPFTSMFSSNHSLQNGEIPFFSRSARHDGEIRLAKLNNGFFCGLNNIIPITYDFKNRSNIVSIVHSGNVFLMFWSDNSEGYNSLKAGKINRDGEWVIDPINLYKKTVRCNVGNNEDISAFSFSQSNQNEITFAFRDRTFGRTSFSAREKCENAILIYRLSMNLEIVDSIIFTMGLRWSAYDIQRTHLLRKDNVYLLLVEVRHRNDRRQLYYKLLNENLTPKTDFIKLSDFMRLDGFIINVADPILTSEGFMITWVDNDISEDVLRSVLIDTAGRQSDIINITNQRIDRIFNVKFDDNHVDIYLFSRNQNEGALIRKRINTKEYWSERN